MAGKPFVVGAKPGAADLNNLAGVYDRVTTAVDIVNLATEQTLYAKTITGGHLSTNRALELVIVGDYLNNSAAAKTLTLRVKYGGTTMWGDVSDAIANSASRRRFRISVVLANLGVTNSQWADIGMYLGQTVAGSVAGIGHFVLVATTATGNESGAEGTAAVDSTVDQTFAVTAQHSAADPLTSVRLQYARLLLS